MNTYDPWQVCGQQKTTCKSLFFIPCEFQASNTGLEKTLFTGQASHLPHCSQSVHQGRVKKQPRKNTGQVWTLTSPQDDSALTLVNFKMRHVWFSSNVTVRAFFYQNMNFVCTVLKQPIRFCLFAIRLFSPPLWDPLPPRSVRPFLRGKRVWVFHFQPTCCWTSYFHTLVLMLNHCEGRGKENVWRAWDHNAFTNDALLSSN